MIESNDLKIILFWPLRRFWLRSATVYKRSPKGAFRWFIFSCSSCSHHPLTPHSLVSSICMLFSFYIIFCNVFMEY